MILRKQSHKSIVIILTVFITGMATMILELVGSRIITPYFGSSIFTWTSLIGIILASLSIGYWLGGKLADKKTSLEILSKVLLINSLLCILIYFFSDLILNVIFLKISNISFGTFISSFIIFTVPSIFFGIIPPYAAKLTIKSLDTSGQSVGNLYAISTVGSIIGTFLTGYYLLSVIGSFQIILLIGMILLLNSLILNFKSLIIFKLFLLFVFLWLLLSNKQITYPLKHTNVIDTVTSSYNNYYIVEWTDNSGKVRGLMDNFNTIQSGYRINQKDELLFDYLKYFTLPACYGKNNKVLMIGGGGFSYAKYFLDHFPQSTLDVVEIDPELTSVAEDYFDLPNDSSKLNIINTDARMFLNNNSNIYDSILVDVFDSFSIPFHVITKEAVQKMRESLSENGIIVMNIATPMKSKRMTLLDAEYNTFRKIFPLIEIYKVDRSSTLESTQNVILVAYQNPDYSQHKECLFKKENLSGNKINSNYSKSNLFLTDNFAPVEFLSLPSSN